MLLQATQQSLVLMFRMSTLQMTLIMRMKSFPNKMIFHSDDESKTLSLKPCQRPLVGEISHEAIANLDAGCPSAQMLIPTKPFDRAPIALSDGELSIAHLVKKQDLGNGMLDPREYQIELFERAKTQNTIAVLDTGIAK